MQIIFSPRHQKGRDGKAAGRRHAPAFQARERRQIAFSKTLSLFAFHWKYALFLKYGNYALLTNIQTRIYCMYSLFSVWLPFNSQQSNKIVKQRSVCRLKHHPFPIMIRLAFIIDLLNFSCVIFSIFFKFYAFILS